MPNTAKPATAAEIIKAHYPSIHTSRQVTFEDDVIVLAAPATVAQVVESMRGSRSSSPSGFYVYELIATAPAPTSHADRLAAAAAEFTKTLTDHLDSLPPGRMVVLGAGRGRSASPSPADRRPS